MYVCFTSRRRCLGPLPARRILFALLALAVAGPLHAQAFEPAGLLRYVAPDYPPASLQAGIEADVQVTLALDNQGTVRAAIVEEGPPRAFVEAVRAAARSMKFSPARSRGKTFSSNLELGFHFHLQRRPIEEVPQPLSTAAPATIAGEVLSAGARTPLAGVEVLVVGLGLGATTDAHGHYSVTVPPGDHQLLVAAPEYRTVASRITVEAGASARLDFRSYRSSAGGFEATVLGEKRQVAASKSTVVREELRNVPGSQNDPIRVLENLPGLARTPLAGGQLIVRGARALDTGAYYDGQRIPILYHLLNGPSVMAEEMVERIDFFAGGAGAYYGRQLAGIVEVIPRRSDVDRFHGSAAVDLGKSSAFLQGNVAEDSRFSVGGRVSYVNPVLKFFSDSLVPYQVPVYWDYQGRFEQKLPDSSRLYVTAFGSGDSFAQINNGRGNVNAYSDQEVIFHRLQLRWDKRITGDTTLSVSPQLGFGHDVTRLQGSGPGAFAEPQRTADQSRSLGLRAQLATKWSDQLEGHLGTDITFDRVAYQADRTLAQRIGVVQSGLTGQRVQFDGLAHQGNFGGYAEAILNLPRLRITPGVRVDAFHWTGHTQAAVDPRLWVRAQVTPTTAVYGYTGLYHQAPEPTELDPKFGNPDLSIESSQQHGLGAEQRLGSDWSIRVEGFLQRRNNLPYAGQLSLKSDGTVDAPFLVNSGYARSAGLEVLIRRELSGRFYGWLAYTLSRSQQIQRPGYAWEPTQYDQPHVLTLLLGLRLSTQVEFSVRLRYASGNPVQSAEGSIFNSDNGSYQPYALPFGATRLPAFTQVDFQVNNIWTADDYRLSLYVELLNLLGRRNAEVLVYDYRFTQPDSIPGLPLMGSAGAKVSW